MNCPGLIDRTGGDVGGVVNAQIAVLHPDEAVGGAVGGDEGTGALHRKGVVGRAHCRWGIGHVRTGHGIVADEALLKRITGRRIVERTIKISWSAEQLLAVRLGEFLDGVGIACLYAPQVIAVEDIERAALAALPTTISGVWTRQARNDGRTAGADVGIIIVEGLPVAGREIQVVGFEKLTEYWPLALVGSFRKLIAKLVSLV